MANMLVLNVTTIVNYTTATPETGGKYPSLDAFSEQYATIHGYAAVAICVWGIMANLANIVVLTRPTMSSATNTILLWLAVADLLTMASYLPAAIHFYVLRQPGNFPTTYSVHWIRFMLFHVSFAVVCHTVAIWLTIGLAVFRALFVCLPTRGSTWCSQKRAGITVMAVYASTIIICLPNYLVTTIRKRTDNTTNSTMYEFADSALAEMYPSLNNINYWIQAVLVKLVPCILMTVLTCILLHAMHVAKKRRHHLVAQGKRDESERAREHNRTTRMLFAVVVLFLLTELPQGILTMCSIFLEGFFVNVYWPLGDILDATALLNNSINFVLYCTMSRQFRQTFVNVFCPERCRCWRWLSPGNANSKEGWLPLHATKFKANNGNMHEGTIVETIK